MCHTDATPHEYHTRPHNRAKINAPIIRDITLHNNPLLLQLRMRKPIRPQHRRLRRLLLLPSHRNDAHPSRRPLLLRRCQPHILQVRLILLQLTPHIIVMVANRLIHRLETLRLQQDLLPQVPEVRELRPDLVLHQLVPVRRLDDLQLLELTQHLLHFDALTHERRVLRRRRALGDRRQVIRALLRGVGDRTHELDEDRFRLHVEHVRRGDGVGEGGLDVLYWGFPARVELQLERAVLFAWDLGRGGSEFVGEDAEVLFVIGGLGALSVLRMHKGCGEGDVNTHKSFYVLCDQGMCVVQFVKGDMNHQVFLRQSHVLVHLEDSQKSFWMIHAGRTHLKSVVEVSDLAEVVQELVDPRLVVLHERVQRHHVCLLRVRRLVGQILQHLRDLIFTVSIKLEL